MTTIIGLTKEIDEVSQEIDLSEYGIEDDVTALLIGQDMIDLIKERTREQNKSVHNRSLADYSDSYIESDEFEAFNKSENDVNLTLTGDMIDSLDVISYSPTKIKIGWEDELNNAKAYGHITGMEGHPWLEGKVKKRDFFGVSKSDLEKIISKYAVNDVELKDEKTVGEIFNLLNELDNQTSNKTIEQLLGDIFA